MNDRASNPSSLATAIRHRRRDLGLDQVELAELAGCSTRFVHSVEAGKATLRFDKLLDLLRVLGLSLRLVRATDEMLVPDERPGPTPTGS